MNIYVRIEESCKERGWNVNEHDLKWMTTHVWKASLRTAAMCDNIYGVVKNKKQGGYEIISSYKIVSSRVPTEEDLKECYEFDHNTGSGGARYQTFSEWRATENHRLKGRIIFIVEQIADNENKNGHPIDYWGTNPVHYM